MAPLTKIHGVANPVYIKMISDVYCTHELYHMTRATRAYGEDVKTLGNKSELKRRVQRDQALI